MFLYYITGNVGSCYVDIRQKWLIIKFDSLTFDSTWLFDAVLNTYIEINIFDGFNFGSPPTLIPCQLFGYMLINWGC